MQLGTVIGHATSTVKHPSFNGIRMAIVQPLDVNRKPEADPLVVFDKLGAGLGQTVILNSDGIAARQFVSSEKTPARWFVIGIVDE